MSTSTVATVDTIPECLICNRCGMDLYATQWLQVQCLTFRERFKDLNNCSLEKQPPSGDKRQWAK